MFFFSIISFVFVFKVEFLFCFYKFSNLKDQLDFNHLSHKLNCLIRIISNFMHQIRVANYNLEAMRLFILSTIIVPIQVYTIETHTKSLKKWAGFSLYFMLYFTRC